MVHPNYIEDWVQGGQRTYAALCAARANFGDIETSFIRAAGLGVEPRYADPESAVLPLDDPAIERLYVKTLVYSTE